MSGNHRLDIGDITQGKLKGKALESAIAKALDDETPHVKERRGNNPITRDNKKHYG